jgi:UDP-N-acetylglucosamine diphosphorylase / glucose-1-phosphate thymidylyltransferase / UDP-N-acetylgalactosamine diphosphorylase / glucosamine-1-phosphate N-acetyltransferase / galactosamine-1-phosphate N-acetyltransferase
MPLTMCMYEDDKFSQFFPLTHLRPVALMRSGIVPQVRRCDQFFPQAQVCLATRESLASLAAAQRKDCPVNIVKRGEGSDVLFLNGRIRDFGNLPQLVSESRVSTVFRAGDEAVGVLLRDAVLRGVGYVTTPDSYVKAFNDHREDIADLATSATLYGHCWDFVADIERAVTEDFAYLKATVSAAQDVKVHPGSHIVNPDSVFLGNAVEVMPGAVIDASKGPVCVGDYTRIEPHAAVFGPAFIGCNSVVLAGKITASSIGHTCRVGGEVEESVFQSYVNKYHAGFIGHSYVGSWVNFGAMTTNSDLKNNYSTIRVTVNGQSVDTGSIKVGSFIGDHTKFGIGTLLNTGISIGVCCNIFGGKLVTDKDVPSYRWGQSAQWEEYRFEKAIETARKTAGRRNVDLTKDEESVLRAISAAQPSDTGILRF